mmetsp:Transcript_19682/g.52548  ORF Transcript_19682/g.52548 Transcript_19682/m.52548 type:complete len:252 (+) Transcript_19682:918-1673(+)
MGHALEPSSTVLDVVQRHHLAVVLGRSDASVNAQDPVFDQGSQRKPSKDVVERVQDPWTVNDAVLRKNLGFKTIHLVDFLVLVVSTDEPDALRIKHFEAQQQQKRLTRARASVNVVTQEEVLDGLNVSRVVLRLPEVAKKKEKVRELPMDIAKDLARRSDIHHRRLRLDKFPHDLAEERYTVTRHLLRDPARWQDHGFSAAHRQAKACGDKFLCHRVDLGEPRIHATENLRCASILDQRQGQPSTVVTMLL